MPSSRRMTHLLGRVEERLRVRLHQAANRMEDHDPLDVAVARAGVRVLDVVDRATGFRAAHRAAREIPEGTGRAHPPPRPLERPELGGLDPAALTAAQRGELKALHRRWIRSDDERDRAAWQDAVERLR